jgi:hypothetical protein
MYQGVQVARGTLRFELCDIAVGLEIKIVRNISVLANLRVVKAGGFPALPSNTCMHILTALRGILLVTTTSRPSERLEVQWLWGG